MKRRIYPRKFLLMGIFTLIAYECIAIIYLVLGAILEFVKILPLHLELMMEYHVLTVSLPLGFVIAMIYWASSKITIKKDELLIKSSLRRIRREKIKVDEIVEICAHEIESTDSTLKFHIHLADKDLKIIEFWYDENSLLTLAKELVSKNPKIKVNKKLQAIIA